MNVSEITKFSLPSSSEEVHYVFSAFGPVPLIFSFSGCELSVYNAVDGSLRKKLRSPDVIENVIECSFDGYEYCIAALSYSFCNIWSDMGKLFSVVLPCRMSSMHSIGKGILFERIDDLISMNTSFTISTPVHSIPMYFTLLSPLSIPKPVLQKQEGEDLTVTALNLSRLVNTSIDLFNSRIGDMQEREVSIISVLRDVHLLLIYSTSTSQHSLYRWISTDSALLGLPSERVILEAVMNDNQTSLNDTFIQLLCSPEYCLERVFQGMDSLQAFQYIKWVDIDSHVFIYCQLENSVHIYQTRKESFIDPESPFTLVIDFITEVKGVVIDRITDTPFVLISREGNYSILLGSTILIPYESYTNQIMEVENCSLNLPLLKRSQYSINDRILTIFNGSYIEQYAIYLKFDSISEKLLKIVDPLLGRVSYFQNAIKVVSDAHALLFLADYSWILNDISTLSHCISLLSAKHVLISGYLDDSPFLWEVADESSDLPISMILELALINPRDKRICKRMELYGKYQVAGEIPQRLLHSFITHEFNDQIGIGSSPILNFYELMANKQRRSHNSIIFKRSSLLQEIWNLLSPHVVNLHLSSDNNSVNVPRAIHEAIEAQLLSVLGNALIQHIPTLSPDPSWLQQLHSLSFHLNLSGRKNDESDIMDCDFSRSTLFYSRIQHTIVVLSPWLCKYSSYSLTINDLDYLLEDHPLEEQIGILLSLGISGHIRSIPLALYKHKLVFCYSHQWSPDSNHHVEIDYQLEAAYLLALVLAYKSTEHHQVINFLEFYIESITHISNPKSPLSFDWKSNKRQSICLLFFVAILGLGIVCLNTQNQSVIHTLTSLMRNSLEDKPINLTRYYITIVISLALITQSSMEIPPWDEERLRKPVIGQILATGTTIPVEERPGLILAQGFFSSSNIQLFNKESATEFILSQREDVVFFYGASVSIAGFHNDAFSWLPEEFLHEMDYSEKIKKWYSFIGGVLYAGCLMQYDGMERYIQWVIALFCQAIQSEKIEGLKRFPLLFLSSSLHAIGICYCATLDKKIFILLRTLYLSFVSLHMTELIQSAATAIGLVAFSEGKARLMFSRDTFPLCFLAFLPIYPSHLGDDSLLPDIFRQLWRCCTVKQQLVCMVNDTQSVVEVDVKVFFEDGSSTVLKTPGYLNLSNVKDIEVMSDRYSMACTIEEVRKSYQVWLEERKPLFKINVGAECTQGVELTREEHLLVEQSDNGIMIDLIVMKKRCKNAIEKRQMKIVERWFSLLKFLIC